MLHCGLELTVLAALAILGIVGNFDVGFELRVFEVVALGIDDLERGSSSVGRNRPGRQVVVGEVVDLVADRIEENHEAYVTDGKIAASRKVRSLAAQARKGGSR